MHFALDNDDGGRTRQYGMADIILVGVSRSGKTPTSLYLALQFGIRATATPSPKKTCLITDSPARSSLIKAVFGLLIDVDRLVKIREEQS